MTKARLGSRATLLLAGLLVIGALALTLTGLPVDAASTPSSQDDATSSGELAWYTPHDTPWSDWTVLEGSEELPIHEEAWGPTVRFEDGGDEPVARSPVMEDWDRAVLWLMVEDAGTGDAKGADLFEVLDAQGDPVMLAGYDSGGFEFAPWDPEEDAWDGHAKESIHGTPVVSGNWYRIEIEPLDGEIRVTFGYQNVTVPNRSGEPAFIQASPADPWSGDLDWFLGGLRVTRGAIVDDGFTTKDRDPRIVVDATDPLAKAELRHRQSADPDTGLIAFQGSPLPAGRAFAAAPVDPLAGEVLAETSFRIFGQHTWNQPTHHALLAGLWDDAGAPGEATWQLAFSPVWLEERRQHPTHAEDPVPDPRENGEPWGLYLHVQHKAPQRLATFDAVELGTWHMLTVTLGENEGTIWLDREPLGTYELWSHEWVGIGDVNGHGTPVMDRSGGGTNAIAHSGLFVASAGPTEVGGELAWYTPHDTPWSAWTVEAGSFPTLVDESWGPTLAFGSGTDDASLVSPGLGDWDRLSTWFRSEEAMTAKNALLYEALDDQGEVLFRLGIEAGVLEAWHPDTHTSIDRLPAYILGSAWHQLVFLESHEGIEVHLSTGRMDIPLDPGDEVSALRVGSTGDEGTRWQLAGLRVTQGPVLAEAFELPALDPRVTLEHPEHGGDIEHRTAGGLVPPGRGSISIEGSVIPGERAMVTAPIGDGPLVAETSFKVQENLATHLPDHQAILAGLSDAAGSPGEAVWAVTVASLAQEGLRTDPLGSPDQNPAPQGGEPLWGLYLDDGSGSPELLEAFAADGWRLSHVLTAELDPATNTVLLTLDREPLTSAPLDLASTDWLALGDVSTDGLPLATRTGGSEGDILHGSFFIAGLGLAGLP